MMDLLASQKAEIVSLILNKQLELLELQETDYGHVMYLDEIKDVVWESYMEDIGEE